jgi:multiple sugar transport system ATP-binding protein
VHESGGQWTFRENAAPSAAADAPERLSLPLDEAMTNLARRAGSPRVILGIRPEDVTLASTPHAATAMTRIEAVETMGAETHLHAGTAAHRLIARLPSTDRYALGAALPLHLDPARLHLFDADSEQVLRAPSS